MSLLCRVTALLLLIAAATARPMATAAATPSPKQMAVPCYIKIYNGFCFTSNDKEACTFYSTPSYSTFKQCAGDKNMGTTVKCADVNADLKTRFADNYKTCVDKEVLSTSTGGGSSSSGSGSRPTWTKKDNTDVSGRDIAAAGKGWTEVCAGVDQVQQRCVATTGCVGFTHNGKCGYLKSNLADSKGRTGWTLYVLKRC